MKFYRRHIEITPKDEMHLEVDHSLESFEITEDDIWEIIDEYSRSNQHESNFVLQEDFAVIAKEIYTKIIGD